MSVNLGMCLIFEGLRRKDLRIRVSLLGFTGFVPKDMYNCMSLGMLLA